MRYQYRRLSRLNQDRLGSVRVSLWFGYWTIEPDRSQSQVSRGRQYVLEYYERVRTTVTPAS